MPCPTIQCEFCLHPFRTDRYAIHIKSKHVRDLARQFLEDSEKPLFNPIKSITNSYKAQNIPVYSRRDDGAVFYFGTIPRYFQEEESYGKYINDEENMTKHEQFLKEVIDAIPLSAFLLRQKPTQFQFSTLHTK